VALGVHVPQCKRRHEVELGQNGLNLLLLRGPIEGWWPVLTHLLALAGDAEESCVAELGEDGLEAFAKMSLRESHAYVAGAKLDLSQRVAGFLLEQRVPAFLDVADPLGDVDGR
jgi:hypothetical protein